MLRHRTVLGICLLGFCCLARPLPATGSTRFLMFPLENRSRSATLGWLSEGIALSLSEGLRTPGIEAIDREDRIRLVEGYDLPPNALLSRGSMIWVARQASADHLITGSYSGTPDDIRIALREFNLKTLKSSREITVRGPVAMLPQMENELAWLVLASGGVTTPHSRENFRTRARAVPNSAYSVYIRSLTTSEEGERLRLLRQAVQTHGDFPEAQFLLGRYYFQTGDYPGALKHLEVARRGEKTYLQCEFMIATCHLKLDALSEAIQGYSHVLSLVPSFEVLNNMGVACLRKGDIPLAVWDLLEARNLAPANPTVALNLAIARHLQGNDAAARKLLEDTLQSYPGNSMLRYVLSVVMGAQGEAEEAAAALAEAQRLGLETVRLQSEGPKGWPRILTTWKPPASYP